MDIDIDHLKTAIEYASQRFRVYFTQHHFPRITCPTCRFGLLELEPESFKFYETVESVCHHSHPDWDPDWIRYVFVGFLKCNNKRCSERVACSGEGSAEQSGDCGTGEQDWEETFYPRFFVPLVDIFPIPTKCPEPVQDILRESFSVAWQDFSAAGNKLRISIEKMIDIINPGGTGELHDKLKALRNTNPEISDMLMAIKWIGNMGSHTSDLKECDVAVAYQVMARVLEKLYGNERFWSRW